MGDTQDKLRECVAGFCSDRNRRGTGRLVACAAVCAEFHCHHTAGESACLCDGRACGAAGPDYRWTIECYVWECGRTYRQYYCPAKERDPHCPGQYAGEHLVQHPARAGLLLLRWRIAIQGTNVQLDGSFHHVLAHDGCDLELDHSRHLV